MPVSDKITSPEQLNEYIRVTNPGAWLILSAILVFLAGFFFWTFAGNLEESFTSYVYTESGKSYALLSQDTASRLKPGVTVRIAELAGKEGKVSRISRADGDKIRVDVDVNNAPAVSRAVFVISSVKPLTFLLR